LITGATGTGKTVTLQGLAEGFSDQGVPVFCADVKSDMSGLAEAGEPKPWIAARAKEIGFKNGYRTYPANFWDLLGEQGHPIRATISEMGPLLLSRLLTSARRSRACSTSPSRSPTRRSCRSLISRTCRGCLRIWRRGQPGSPRNTAMSPRRRVGSIQRSLLVLEQQGGEHFFGEPALKIKDLMRTTLDGRGYISSLPRRS
jgi:uncharacterized protein